jgi:hypothetical protein
LPVYLDADVADFIQQFAIQKKVDTQTVINKILGENKKIIQAIQ